MQRKPLFLLLVSLVVMGCSRTPQFQPNLVEIEKQEYVSGWQFTLEQKQDVQAILQFFFGTPDDPKFPNEYLEAGADQTGHEPLIDVALLKRAAGPVYSDEQGKSFGFYREHCAMCHGLSGDGKGPLAATLRPYPRDFRLGKFKYKSTPFGDAPTKDDLTHVVRRGIPGVGMPSFELLQREEDEIRALVQYVVYLSIRGRVERRLIYMLTELDEDERLWNVDRLEQAESLSPEPDDIRFAFENFVEPEIERFEDAPFRSMSPPVNPYHKLPPVELAAKIKHGQTLFQSRKGGCHLCHGNDGSRDSDLENYDAWTMDWTLDANIDINDEPLIGRFLKLGALPPVTLQPRDFQRGTVRGGATDGELFIRIKNGIEGSGMPPAPASLTDDDIWSLVAFVRSLADSIDRPTASL